MKYQERIEQVVIELRATLTVQEVSRILKKDSQTIRVLLQQGLVGWGLAYKLPNSKQYSYLIYADKFYREIGYQPDRTKDDLIEEHGLKGLINTLYTDLERTDEDSPEYQMIKSQLDRYEKRLNELKGW